MLKLFSILSVFLLVLAINPARASWCRDTDGGVVTCGEIPSSWTECGSFNGEAVYCWPAASSGSRPKKSNSYDTILISVAVGAVFIGAMWYFFGKSPSENSPGQVQLLAF